MAQEQDELTKQAKEREAQLQQLKQSKQTEIKKLKVDLREEQTRIIELVSEVEEMKSREGLSSEELVRIEGQIELIKDVLLRDFEL